MMSWRIQTTTSARPNNAQRDEVVTQTEGCATCDRAVVSRADRKTRVWENMNVVHLCFAVLVLFLNLLALPSTSIASPQPSKTKDESTRLFEYDRSKGF